MSSFEYQQKTVFKKQKLNGEDYRRHVLSREKKVVGSTLDPFHRKLGYKTSSLVQKMVAVKP